MIMEMESYSDGRVLYSAIQSDLVKLPTELRFNEAGSKCMMLDTNKDYVMVAHDDGKTGYWNLVRD